MKRMKSFLLRIELVSESFLITLLFALKNVIDENNTNVFATTYLRSS